MVIVLDMGIDTLLLRRKSRRAKNRSTQRLSPDGATSTWRGQRCKDRICLVDASTVNFKRIEICSDTGRRRIHRPYPLRSILLWCCLPGASLTSVQVHPSPSVRADRLKGLKLPWLPEPVMEGWKGTHEDAVDMVLDHPVPLAVHIIAYSHRTDLGHIPMCLCFWVPLVFYSRE
jgi:hypothetical protein